MSVPAIVLGPDGPTHVWRVGDSTVSAFPSGGGWGISVSRPAWGPDPLRMEGRFATLEQAVAWCERMVAVLRQDDADDQRSF